MTFESKIFGLAEGKNPVVGCKMAVPEGDILVETRYDLVKKEFSSSVSFDPREVVNWIRKAPQRIKTWKNPKIPGILEKCNNNKEVISEGLQSNTVDLPNRAPVLPPGPADSISDFVRKGEILSDKAFYQCVGYFSLITFVGSLLYKNRSQVGYCNIPLPPGEKTEHKSTFYLRFLLPTNLFPKKFSQTFIENLPSKDPSFYNRYQDFIKYNKFFYESFVRLYSLCAYIRIGTLVRPFVIASRSKLIPLSPAFPTFCNAGLVIVDILVSIQCVQFCLFVISNTGEWIIARFYRFIIYIRSELKYNSVLLYTK